MENKLKVINDNKLKKSRIIIENFNKNKLIKINLKTNKTEAESFKKQVNLIIKNYYFHRTLSINQEIKKDSINKILKNYIEKKRKKKKLLDKNMIFLKQKMRENIDVLNRLRDK